MIEQMQKRELEKSPETKRNLSKEQKNQLNKRNEEERDRQLLSIKKIKDNDGEGTFNDMLKLTNDSLNICHGLENQFKIVREEMKYG